MMQAVISSAAAARLREAEAFVARWGPAAEVIVMGATREAADDFCRRLARRGGATFGLHRFTLGQFASRTAGAHLAAQGIAVSSSLGAEAVAARALFEVGRGAPLVYLDPIAEAPGLPRALASTIGELREAGLDAAAVTVAGATGPDLARLLTEYDRQLGLAGAADRARLLGEAARLVRVRAPGTLTGLPVLLLDVRLTSVVEQSLVAALGETSPLVLMTVPAGDERTLALLPPGTIRLDVPANGSASPALARLRTDLFSPQPGPETADTGDVRFFSAPGEGREAVEVARRVLDEADRGVPFDEIAIVVRSPELYWSPLEQALTRAKVPAWYARGTRRPDPTGRAFLALLACRADGLSARRFGEYLSLGQVPRRDEAGAPAPEPPPLVAPRDESLTSGQLSLLDLFERTQPAVDGPAGPPSRAGGPTATDPGETVDDERTDVRTPWKWESLLVEAAVVGGGASRWRRRLDGLSQELALRARELESEEAGSPQAEAVARDRDALDDLRRFALPIVDDLAALPDAATWGEWLDRFTALAPRALRHPARVLELLADLRPLAAIGPVTLTEVRRVLVPRLALLEREPPRLRFGRVFVCTPDQIRGRAFRVVLVLGLAERLFPQRSRQDPLLLDEARVALADGAPGVGALIDVAPARGELGVVAPTFRPPHRRTLLVIEDDRVSAERLLLRLVVGAATERLYVSYPRLDVAQARARVPSFYALDIRRALTGVVPNHEQFERETARDTGAWLAWPAPDDPDTAIDDWEHDLGVLGRLLRPEPGRTARHRPAKGSAHYLLELNPALKRSLRSRWGRWRKRWSQWDGLIGQHDPSKVRLASQRLTARPYSVSALQRFAACPYQFLLGAIYRFQPLERPESIVQLDPLTKGGLFHEIQRDLWRRLASQRLLPIPPARRDAVQQVLEEVCREALTRAHDSLAPAIERVWDDETDLMRADLRMWLDRLVDAGGEWVPRYFELSFGLALDADHDPASVPDPVVLDGRFAIRGAIDLIEEHAVFGTLRVTDHKTGRNRTTPSLVVGGGGTLQPVIYGLVAERLFDKRVMQARLSFATTAGEFAEHVVSLRDDARRAGIEVLEIIDRAVESGSLPPAPRDGACAWCDFRAVCGPLEERRVADKARDLAVIQDLDALRRLR